MFDTAGAWGSICIRSGCSGACAIFVHAFHLEDDLECSVEHFVETLLLLGGADDEALEGVLLCSSLDLGIGHALTKLSLITTAFELLSKIELGADEDAGAGASGRLDLGDPLLTSVLQRVTLHQTEANDETVSVSVCDWAETAEIFVTSRVPNLQLHLAALVVLRSVVRIEHCRLVQARENFLCPRHDDGGLSDGGVADEHQLHVMLLVLIYQWFSLHHFVQ